MSSAKMGLSIPFWMLISISCPESKEGALNRTKTGSEAVLGDSVPASTGPLKAGAQALSVKTARAKHNCLTDIFIFPKTSFSDLKTPPTLDWFLAAHRCDLVITPRITCLLTNPARQTG
jgi:hypothetical protein